VIPATGRLVIVEAFVPEGSEPSPTKNFDMAMMLFPNGMERTEVRSKLSFDPDQLSQSLPGFIACRLDYLCPATDSEV
jgi:hypothetical protein